LAYVFCNLEVESVSGIDHSQAKQLWHRSVVGDHAACCIRVTAGLERPLKDVLPATSVGREGSTAAAHRCSDAEQAACFGVCFKHRPTTVLHRPAIVVAKSRRPLTAETWVGPQASTY